jgi:uncharacterized protein YndB with AHSA1/START domain/ketosteroid isomerase-like protein
VTTNLGARSTVTEPSTALEEARGVVEREGRRGLIHFRRHLAHPVDRVWEAIATPEGLAEWWLPFPSSITIDLRVGGEIRFDPQDPDVPTMTCEILEVEPPRRLVHTHLDGVSTIKWELEPRRDGCVLTLTQATDDIDAAIAQRHVVGLHTSLDRLGPALDGSPVAWDWDGFAVRQREYEADAPRDTSARADAVRTYMQAFAAGDRAAVLRCLTDDVVWDIVGEGVHRGKDAFAAHIGGDEHRGLPDLAVDATYASGDVVVALGHGSVGLRELGTFAFRFSDRFTFRDDLIARLDSYVVPTTAPAEEGNHR